MEAMSMGAEGLGLIACKRGMLLTVSTIMVLIQSSIYVDDT